MKLINSSIKYNLLSFDELVISLDRLSRFKTPEEIFPRVFHSVIFKHLLYPKYSKKDIDFINIETICNIFTQIWNDSVKTCCNCSIENDFVFDNLISIIRSTFSNIDENTNFLLNSKLSISPILKKLDYKTASYNLKFLIKILEQGKNNTLEELREKYSLMFPISKLLIVEGITEEILLPVFADKLNKSFEKNGIYIMGAGGKSKSPSLYMKLRDRLKIPIIFLFDKDAQEICNNLSLVLNSKDKIILLEQGEFEDILSINLIKRALNSEYILSDPIVFSDLRSNSKMCENLELFYRTRHLGEFKKSKFAKIIADNIKYKTDISPEITNIISMIY